MSLFDQHYFHCDGALAPHLIQLPVWYAPMQRKGDCERHSDISDISDILVRPYHEPDGYVMGLRKAMNKTAPYAMAMRVRPPAASASTQYSRPSLPTGHAGASVAFGLVCWSKTSTSAGGTP